MNMKGLIRYVVLLFSLSSISSAETLRIHGSNTVGATLVPELALRWLKERGYKVVDDRVTAKEERLIEAVKTGEENLDIEIHAHGSSTSFRSLAAGLADIGMSSRPIKNKELKKLAKLGQLDKPNTEYIIAIDGLSVIVHPKNPLKQISKDKLNKIFSGKITNWSQLGLSKAPINVYARDDKSGTYDTFKSLVLGKKTLLVKGASRYESNAKLSDDVSKDPYAIGFVGLAYVNKSRALSVSEEGAIALYPSIFNVATEDYALSRRLFLYVPEKNRHPLADSFANFAASNTGQKIAGEVGFVSQEVMAYKKQVNNKAPDEYKELVKNARRLSLNIRFRKGQTKLDNKAAHDVGRLFSYMKKPENKGKRLILMGFADSHEVIPYLSLTLSIDRADTVADKLVRQRIAPDRVRGYGDVMPISSNSTEHGRLRNRRVEVWVHDSDR